MDLQNEIEMLGKAHSIDELTKAYNTLAVEIATLFSGNKCLCGLTEECVQRILDRIANYNTVRVANTAYEEMTSGIRTSSACIVDISKCREFLHGDCEIETGLLDELCHNLGIDKYN